MQLKATLLVATILTFGVVPSTFPAPTREAIHQHSLLSAAQSKGTVRILVELRLETPFQPGGTHLSPIQVEAPQAAIAGARDELLNDPALDRVILKAAYKSIPYVALEVDAEALGRLASSPQVKSIIEDLVLAPTLTHSPPLIGAESAWNRGLEGSGQAVVVVDTGVEAGHPFFGGRVVSEACFSSSTSTEEATSVCPNGLGTMIGPGAASPEKCTGVEGCSHGTHIAGVAAGFDSSFHGVGRSADIIAIQVFSRFDDPSRCGGEAPCLLSFVSDQLRALEHINDLRQDYNIAAINMSLGGGAFSEPCENEIRAYTELIGMLRAAGIATIVGSGNDGLSGSTSFPGCIAEAITVGATSETDELAPFSNHAAWVDLLAPGDSIVSSVSEGEYGIRCGTSTAAAHVAGTWAILKGAHPDAGIDEILSALQSTGVQLKDPANGETTARIHVDRALSSLDQPDVANASGDDTGLSNSADVLATDTEPPAAVTLSARVAVGFDYTLVEATAVSSSGQTEANTKEKAVDGNLSTVWSTPGRSSMVVEQITLDLGSVMDVGRVNLFARADNGAYFPRDFQIQLSNDNVNFTTVQTETDVSVNAGEEYPVNITPPISRRYVRIRVTRSNMHPTGLFYVQLAEIEVYRAVAIPGNAVILSWIAPGDDGMEGLGAAVYEIRGNTTGINNMADFIAIGPGQVTEPIPQPTGTPESFTLTGLPAESNIYIAMVSADEETPANISDLSNVVMVTTPEMPPGKVTTLTAVAQSDSSIKLTWNPVGDDGMIGQASIYDIRYSTSPITSDAEFNAAHQVSGEPAPTPVGSPPQEVTVGSLQPDTLYHFAMKVGDEIPNWSLLSNSTSDRTDDTVPPAAVTLSATVLSGLDYVLVAATAVSSSGQTEANTKEKAVDGNLSTVWSTPGRSSMVVEQITLDLGSVMDVGRVNLFARADNGAYFPRDFQIQLSNDNVNFTTVQTETDVSVNAGEEYPVNITPPISRRYVRIRVTRSNMHPTGLFYVQLAEIEVYRAVAIPGNAVILSWIAPGDNGMEGSGAAVYEIRGNTAGINNMADFIAIGPGQVTEPTPQPTGTPESFTLTGLPAESNIYIAMVSADDETPANISNLSNVVMVTTPGMPPAAITDLTAEAGSSPGSINLQWTASGDDGMVGRAVAYDIRYAGSPIVNDTDFNTAVPVAGEPTPAPAGTPEEMTVGGLQPNGEYYFAMKVEDEAGNRSPLSNSARGLTNDTLPPAAIDDLTASLLGEVVKLSWTAPGDDGFDGQASSYEIRYSTSPITTDLEFDAADQVANEPTPGPAGVLQNVTISGLPPDTYYFVAVSYDEAPNRSPLSNSAEVSVHCVTNCNILPTSNLAWDPSSSGGIAEYRIYVSTTPGVYDFDNPAASVPASDPLEWSLINYGFQIGVRYCVVVTAADDLGNQSTPSNEVDFTIDPITGLATFRGHPGPSEK